MNTERRAFLVGASGVVFGPTLALTAVPTAIAQSAASRRARHFQRAEAAASRKSMASVYIT